MQVVLALSVNEFCRAFVPFTLGLRLKQSLRKTKDGPTIVIKARHVTSRYLRYQCSMLTFWKRSKVLNKLYSGTHDPRGCTWAPIKNNWEAAHRRLTPANNVIHRIINHTNNVLATDNKRS